MLLQTFNSYSNAITQESVRLTNSTLIDIEDGNRNPILNGEIVTLREKIIAAYLLDQYALIMQEYVLTDFSGLDFDSRIIRNLHSRETMRNVLTGVNRLTDLGLNDSEDFILDRAAVTAHSTNKSAMTTTNGLTQITLSTILRGIDLVFIDGNYVSNANEYYSGLNTADVTFNIPFTANQSLVIAHNNRGSKAEYISRDEQSFFPLPFPLNQRSLVFRNGKLLNSGYSAFGSTSLVFSNNIRIGEKIAVFDSDLLVVDRFTGNGSTQNFPLSFTLSNQNLVFLNETLVTTGFSGEGTTTINFNTAPNDGVSIAVVQYHTP